MTAALTVSAWVGVALTAAAGCAALVARRDEAAGRARQLWLVSAMALTVTAALVAVTSQILVDWPGRVAVGVGVGCVLIPVAAGLGRWTRTRRAAAPVATHVLVTCGLVLLVCAVYVLVVVGLGQTPEGQERTTLGLSVVAAGLAGILAFPLRRRLTEAANQFVYGERHAPEEALEAFGSHMSRAVPMDELILQLVETLRRTLDLEVAEIWTGSAGSLARSVSVPHAPAATIELGTEELPVVASAHAQGPTWLQIWIPDLLTARTSTVLRSVSVTHLGELLGLIVVSRRPDGDAFTEEEDRILVELARQLGLALHNVRLDSALQASLDELQLSNAELAASRVRIVTAADESRREIERNLHDGAQQHLVAMAVKLGLTTTLFDSDPVSARRLLEELRDDLQTSLGALRELAHGIYPPLLRERGLGEALRTAALRSALPTTVEADDVGRHDPEMEAAVYFCCLEAIQNAGKHAGPESSLPRCGG